MSSQINTPNKSPNKAQQSDKIGGYAVNFAADRGRYVALAQFVERIG